MSACTGRFLLLIAAMGFACIAMADPRVPLLGDDVSGEERRVLVTFVDRSIDRRVAGNPLDAYRPRGDYDNSGWSRRVARQIAQRNGLSVLAQWPVTELGVSCVVYAVPADANTATVVDTLQHERAVVSAQVMRSFQTLSQVTADDAAAPSLPVDTSAGDPYLPLQTAFAELDIANWHRAATGHGVRVALIDSGVDLTHPDLKGQIRHAQNLALPDRDGSAADRHGTAVAGVLAARPDNGIGIAGVAPDAEVLALRACWPEQPGSLAARCNTFTLALALNQALRMKSRIINLSLSGPEDPLLRQLVQTALDRGVLVVAARPGTAGDGAFPASMPGVLAVGQSGIDSGADIVAPGTDILTTVPAGGYDFLSGSSFAAPQISGLAAMMLQLNPDWSATEIRAQLTDPAGPLARTIARRHD